MGTRMISAPPVGLGASADFRIDKENVHGMPATPFLEVSEAIALMGGETLYQCMQCGLCSGLCPWPSVDSPFRTRQLIKMGQLGLEGFESDDILYACTTCKLCVNNCPREVAIIDVIRAMRAMIAESGAAPKSLGAPSWAPSTPRATPGPRSATSARSLDRGPGRAALRRQPGVLPERLLHLGL